MLKENASVTMQIVKQGIVYEKAKAPFGSDRGGGNS